MSSKFCRVTVQEAAETTVEEAAAAIDAYLNKVRPQSAASIVHHPQSGVSSLPEQCYKRQSLSILHHRTRRSDRRRWTTCGLPHRS